MVSKRAAEFLAADVRDAIAQLQGLDASIQELEAKREAHRIKLELLKKAIGPEFQTELPLAGRAHSDASAVDTESRAQPPAEASIGTDSANAGGFRAEIRHVLVEAARGMRPRDVLEALLRRGVPFTGKVEPINRTYNELWRMAKKGQVRKRAGLYYSAQTGAMQ